MPIVVQHDCPYCRTKKSGFQVVGSFRRGTNNSNSAGVIQYKHDDWFFLSCGNCKKAISAQYAYSKRGADIDVLKVLSSHGSLEQIGYRYVEHYPKVISQTVPDHVPEKVGVPFEQAIANVAGSNWDAAGTMARKTLEVATKDMARERVKDPDEIEKMVSKTWLKKRIERLAELNLLTSDLADLAQIIKDGGDGAAHDEEPYEEQDARALIQYAEALLTYIYTIPGMVTEIRDAEFDESQKLEVAPAAQ